MKLTPNLWMIVVFLCGMFLLHAIVPSNINGYPKSLNLSIDPLIDNFHASDHLASRFRESEFNRRPMMIYPLKWLNQYFNIPVQLAFNVLSFICLWFCCILLMTLSKRISPGTNSVWAAIFFLSSFPVLFSYLATIWMYDDPIQYICLLGAMILLLNKNYYRSIFCLTLACITRETSILFMPLFMYWQYKEGYKWKLILWLLVPLCWFAVVYYLLPGGIWHQTVRFNTSVRFTAWQENFKDIYAFSETIGVVLLTLGLPWLLIKKYHYAGNTFNKLQTQMITGALYLGIVNTPLVLIAAIAHEARLFILPLLMIGPIMPTLVPWIYREISAQIELRGFLKKLAGFFLIAGAYACFLYYPSVHGTGYIFRLYALFYFTFLLLVYHSFGSQNNCKCGAA